MKETRVYMGRTDKGIMHVTDDGTSLKKYVEKDGYANGVFVLDKEAKDIRKDGLQFVGSVGKAFEVKDDLLILVGVFVEKPENVKKFKEGKFAKPFKY